LMRHGRRYQGSPWKKMHAVWLGRQQFAHPARQIAFQGYLGSAAHALARRDELEAQIRELLPSWSLRPVVDALQSLRGIALITAVTLAAEIGDIRRFRTPGELMAYLGLIPGEDQADRPSGAAGSPRRATASRAGCSLSRPGAIASRPASASRWERACPVSSSDATRTASMRLQRAGWRRTPWYSGSERNPVFEPATAVTADSPVSFR